MIIAKSLLNVSEFSRAIQVIELENLKILACTNIIHDLFLELGIQYTIQSRDNEIKIINNSNHRKVIILDTNVVSENIVKNYINEIFEAEQNTSLILVSKNGNIRKTIKRYCDERQIALVGYNKPRALNKVAKSQLQLSANNLRDFISRIDLNVNIDVNININIDSIMNTIKHLPELIRLIQFVLNDSNS